MALILTCANCGTAIPVPEESELAEEVRRTEADGYPAKVICATCIRTLQEAAQAQEADALRRTISDPESFRDVEDYLIRIIADMLTRGMGVPIRTRQNAEEDYRLLMAPLVLSLEEAGGAPDSRGLVLRWPRGYTVRVTISRPADRVPDRIWAELAARLGVPRVRFDPSIRN
jgi:hypothetical protein